MRHLYHLPSDVFRFIIEQISWWKDLQPLRATCRWARVHTTELLFQNDYDVMRKVHVHCAEKGGIHEFDLHGTQVSDVSGLGTCSSLRTLRLDYTLVCDVSGLGTCTNLRTLKLNGTRVNDVLMAQYAGQPFISRIAPE